MKQISKANPSGKNRRTLKQIDRYPSPYELAEKIKFNAWPYKVNRDYYLARDRALCSLLYLISIRVSEAQKLCKKQFRMTPDKIIIEAIKLSKAERHDKKTGKLLIRKNLYRPEAWVHLEGKRKQLANILLDYLEMLNDNDKLFDIKNRRMHQIVNFYCEVPPHWLRAFGENYLYDAWDKDLMAVASYVSVDPRTLALYIRRAHDKYKDRS
jgi:hypothetical protein